MAALKRLFSWIWPVRVKRLKGKLSPVLEITFENGKKVLNAGEVNYSFGALHDVFRVALQKAKVVEHPPEQVLILGFGAGSVASILVEEYGFDPQITGVEADPEVIRLAREEFRAEQRFPSLDLENTTAERFVATTDKKFDLIAVDVFVEAEVPESCRTDEFLAGLYKCLLPGGRVVYNEMVFPGMEEFPERFSKHFDRAQTHDLHFGEITNRILIGYKKKED